MTTTTEVTRADVLRELDRAIDRIMNNTPIAADLDGLVRDLHTHAFDDCGCDLPTHIANIAAATITALRDEVEAEKLKYAILKGMNAACESKLAEQSEAATLPHHPMI